MSKRRRTSSIASRGQEEETNDESSEPSTSSVPRKRKKPDPIKSISHSDTTLPQHGELCQQLYDTIRNHKKDDGALLCDAFIRVPKRRQEPGYYEVVSNPIDLLKVQQKLKTDEYDEMEDMHADIELMVNNAKAFYKKSSQEYKDACDLWELFLLTKNRLLDDRNSEETDPKGKAASKVGKAGKRAANADQKKLSDDADENNSESSPEDDFNLYEDFFTGIMTAVDADNRPIHTEFQLLPSKKKYPEYYEVIENPIDLRRIASKIQNNEYTSLTEMEKDLLLMTKNACTFNEPGSQIYKNAKALKKVITAKKIEIEQNKASGKSSERIRNKRLRGTQSLSAVTAALKDEETDTDTEEVEEEAVPDDAIDADNPLWQLFEAVRSVTTPGGTPLCEPFMKLPSKRFYKDYYKEIKNPIAIAQIRRKLVKGAYGTVSEVAGDMNIMFENAKKYNIQTSKIYKDAVKLQKIMQTKVQELLDIDQVTQRVTKRARKDTDSDADSETGPKKRGPKPKNSLGNSASAKKNKEALPLRKRLHILCKYLIDYTCEDGRQPMLVFMEKPSKKLYPDYYTVISEPIDLLTIEANIKAEKYASEEELVKDFKLMFSNCRQYNEENSMIYADANMLEKLLLEKVGMTVPTPEKKERTVVRVNRPRKHINPQVQKMRTMYDTIRDFKEPKASRQLSLIFMKLPSKSDYPDYYEVIKNPIDMEKIAHKLKTSVYENLDELVADFILMFDNACKYNEPDSQIYKDALILQRICQQTKLQLKEDDDTVPDVGAAVQDILSQLFISVYNHQDTEGRCFSDSMAELPEHDEVDGKKVRAISLDLIKRRLDRGLYRRLDAFQEDFFVCLERARKLSRTDSQVFEDSIELQSYFIRQRDEICRNGDLLHSPALSYTLMHLTAAVESTKQSKLLQESLEDQESETRSSDDSSIKESAVNSGETMTCNQQTFRVGEYVYLDSKEKGVDPSILLIERLWTQNGQQMLYGNYYLRPVETYHLSTRKFLEKEVFKTETHIAVPLEEVKERCCVLNVKQYFTMKPEGYAEKDIYVCEFRYTTRSRTFKKIKIWPGDPPGLVLVPRETPLEIKRVMSVYRERVEKHKDELAELEEQEKLIEKEKPNVVAFTTNLESEEGNTYYEQYNTICSGVVKTGDFVYVVTDGGRQIIAQIDTIWDTKDGKCYFRGPWLIPPTEIPHTPNRLFYKQEVFLSTMEDTNPLVGIIGKCGVLEYNDYISCRPTEIPEVDVFICQSMYDEVNRQVRKLPADGLKKFTHSNAVTEDEIYYFPKFISPVKVGSDIAQLQANDIKHQTAPLLEVEASPMMTKLTSDVDMLMEDSLDGGPPSVGSGEIPTPVVATCTPVSTPVSSKKNKTGKKIMTGYILYSGEVRKQIAQSNPESTFGEISRIVGNEWRSLTANEKQTWEEKAARCNEENSKLWDEQAQCASPAPIPENVVYECYWDNCDWQFEDMSDLIDHCIKDSQGHVQQYFQQNSDAELNCAWRNCLRRNNKKTVQPFPNLARLVRHVRDMHINKGNGRSVLPNDRSKNLVLSKKQTPVVVRPQPTPSTVTTPAVPPVKPQEPLFISVPPRPQRVLHSEAYIKYIEGLQADNKFISNWEKTLNATPENITTPEGEKLTNVTSWLVNGPGQHENAISALWALRDFMFKDTLGIKRTL